MRVRVCSERCTFGGVGDVVELDAEAVNVAALVAAGLVVPAPPPRPKVEQKKGSGD